MIDEYLKSESGLATDLVKKFLTDQSYHYAGLTKEYAELWKYLTDYLTHGGKWHRPTLALLGCRVAGGDVTEAVRRGVAALELTHRYLLIHDDIIDQDLVRHGKPTVEKIYRDRFREKYALKKDGMYSKGMAMVAGDIVNSLAYEMVTQCGCESAMITAVVRGINQLMVETAAGWQLQTEQNYMEISQVTEEDFFRGMQLVSAQYSMVWPLRIGQIFAGRLTADECDPVLEEYGQHTGAAFQIMDDILGMFGSPEATGKPVGNDYREGKKTFLILKAYAQASDPDKQFLDSTLGTNVTGANIERAQKIITETGALDQVKQMVLIHADAAKKVLKSLKSADPEAVTLLDELADLLANRDH